MNNKKGRLITVEGTEGVGKSTAIAAVCQTLEKRGVSVFLTREPGGTPVAESIRSILLTDHDEPIVPMTELLLMFAGRSQHIEQRVKPALARGEWVISDRFTDASFAYQGAGRELGQEKVRVLADWVQGDCVPDLTILLDAPVEVGLQRMAARGAKDRIEKEGVAFFESIRSAYLQLAQDNPDRFCVVDANTDEETVISSMLTAVTERWETWL
jgi:dTMP kinase